MRRLRGINLLICYTLKVCDNSGSGLCIALERTTVRLKICRHAELGTLQHIHAFVAFSEKKSQNLSMLGERFVDKVDGFVEKLEVDLPVVMM
jgi:hypothetical protein